MDPTQWTSTSLSAIGLATVSYITYKFLRQASVYLLPCQLSRYNRGGNNWALVTGATDGIGFGFCQELCARGFNVILHGRNVEKLTRRAHELQAEFPTRKTGIVVLDVTGTDHDVDGVTEEVRRIIGTQGKLSVLVNNVGGETRPATALTSLTASDVDATVHRNARFMAQITRVVLPFLEEGSERGNPSGFILNVSSFSYYGLPYLSIYSATKGFVTTLTRALEAECKAEGRGVGVMGLIVGEVKTAGYQVESTLFIPPARSLAQSALNRVGCGRVMVAPYFWHWVQGISFEIFPRWMLMKFSVQKMQSIKATVEKSAKSN
ncbi:hypothetical protein PDE_00111 [Penicillium oxalicum 114-2]|uniref:Uncharacterized protein n=1 Tax=Penicillium oxalicum (strain 114-2 / CGMCC 5302) TaxID=933388 RepID=S7Z4Z5_PENO1|nr:hypothetical protein PDE_00111 [Penicillium oxalicum 114-2]